MSVLGGLRPSETAQKALFGTALGVVAAAILYLPAVFAYLWFYYKYLPDQITTVPVHLQYGCVLHFR